MGPEKINGKIFDDIGFGVIEQDLFRHLVITRLIASGSKLKTVDYLERFKGISIDIRKVYRFMDTLDKSLKEQVEQIAFDYTKSVLGGNISVVFNDMTTLHFESSDEDDLRITGFSKDGKPQNPQILFGLLVGPNGTLSGTRFLKGINMKDIHLFLYWIIFSSDLIFPNPLSLQTLDYYPRQTSKILDPDNMNLSLVPG